MTGIDVRELVRRLAIQPEDEYALAETLEHGVRFKPASIQRRLRELQPLVQRHPTHRNVWELGAGAGLILAGAIGSKRLNAVVCDPYGRPIADTLRLGRRVPRLDSPAEILDQLVELVNQALATLPPERQRYVRAIALAVPFGLNPVDYTVVGHGAARLKADEYVRERLRPASQVLGVALDTIPIFCLPDTATEAVAEYWFGDRAPRAAPLLLVKLTREVRAAIVADNGEPFLGARGDTADLGHLQPYLDRAEPLVRLVGHRTCPTCGKTCLQTIVSMSQMFSAIRPGEARLLDAVWDRPDLRADADIFDELFGSVLRAPGDSGLRAREAFRSAGRIVGRCLDGAITLLDPAAVILTGFLARAGQPLLDGLTAACAHHRPDVALAISSGISGELAGTAHDPPQRAHARQPVLDISSLPHQLRPTIGAARLAVTKEILPRLESAAKVTD